MINGKRKNDKHPQMFLQTSAGQGCMKPWCLLPKSNHVIGARAENENGRTALSRDQLLQQLNC